MIARIRRLGGRLVRGWQGVEFRAWRVANRHRERRDVQVYGRYRVCLDVADFRAYRIWRLGGTQREKAEIFAGLCAARPALVIDVGANYGEFSLAPAALGLDCIAIEPNPRVAACLRETFARSPNLRVFEAAASDRSATVAFHFCRGATGSGSLAPAVPGGEADRFAQATVETRVRAIRLDDLPGALQAVRGQGLALKVDVEGFENEVLDGAARLLAAAAWWRALVEFSPGCLSAAGKDARQAWENLRRFRGRMLSSDDEKTVDALGTLPALLPARDVDVLIGAGQMPRPVHEVQA